MKIFPEAVKPGGPGEKGQVDVQKSRLYQQEIQNFDPTLNPPLPACSTITRITSEVVESAVKHSKMNKKQVETQRETKGRHSVQLSH